jgi:diguanylate cyclase (GGDEF)-like protein
LVIVAALVATEVVTSLTPIQLSDSVLSRRIVFWLAIGLVITKSAHDLRDRVGAILRERENLWRRTDALAAATEQLTTIFDSDQVIATATKLAAQLASPPGTPGRRAQYTRVEGSMVRVVSQWDETGQYVADFPLSEHPLLQEVMRTGQALSRPIVVEHLGPEVREMIVRLGLTHGVYVPVHLHGAIDGVMATPVRGQSMSSDLFEYSKAVGHLTELALANARNHELLAAQATTDDLTGLANRRAFDQQLEHRPGRLPFCVIALDLDGLKRVNDTKGHVEGDELLIHFARVLSPVFRSGDMFARMGGDEFAALLFDADGRAGTEAATRVLAALAAAPFRGDPLGVSIGIAPGGPHSNGPAVLAAADAAMYRAKRAGGRRFVVADHRDSDVVEVAAAIIR